MKNEFEKIKEQLRRTIEARKNADEEMEKFVCLFLDFQAQKNFDLFCSGEVQEQPKQVPTIPDRLLNIHELSEKINIEVATLYSWTSQNKIPHYKINSSLRFDYQEVLQSGRAKKSTKCLKRAKANSYS